MKNEPTIEAQDQAPGINQGQGAVPSLAAAPAEIAGHAEDAGPQRPSSGPTCMVPTLRPIDEVVARFTAAHGQSAETARKLMDSAQDALWHRMEVCCSFLEKRRKSIKTGRVGRYRKDLLSLARVVGLSDAQEDKFWEVVNRCDYMYAEHSRVEESISCLYTEETNQYAALKSAQPAMTVVGGLMLCAAELHQVMEAVFPGSSSEIRKEPYYPWTLANLAEVEDVLGVEFPRERAGDPRQ